MRPNSPLPFGNFCDWRGFCFKPDVKPRTALSIKLAFTALTLIALVLVTALIVAISRVGGDSPSPLSSPRATTQPLRVGLIPERDILQQQRRYRALCDYIATKIDRPVELVTSRTYEQILADLKTGEVDAAFLGSLVATLAVDRLNVELVAKPRLNNGRSTYHGVVFVLESSHASSLQDLCSQSVAIVRTTTGGNLFLISEMARNGMFAQPEKLPRLVWVGTHDDVIDEVVAGRADAGAVKDVRLDEYLSHHPEVRVRRLAESAEVPENALVMREGEPPELAIRLRDTLLAMDRDPRGIEVLSQFGAQSFLPCTIQEYSAIYELIGQLEGRWDLVGVPGPPPHRPDDTGHRPDQSNVSTQTTRGS